MTNQKGFTLIELLLVLAIIGIISAIAIPALLGQRSRARDKAAIENATSIMGDLAGAYDKCKEAGLNPLTDANFGMTKLITDSNAKNKNPWDGASDAYTAAIAAAATQSTKMGEVTISYVAPAAGVAGILQSDVLVQNQVAGATGSAGAWHVTKSTNVE